MEAPHDSRLGSGPAKPVRDHGEGRSLLNYAEVFQMSQFAHVSTQGMPTTIRVPFAMVLLFNLCVVCSSWRSPPLTEEERKAKEERRALRQSLEGTARWVALQQVSSVWWLHAASAPEGAAASTCRQVQGHPCC